MALDLSILRYTPVRQPDSKSVYDRYLTLRDMADQRRYREQEYRAQELLARQREQEWQEQQNLRQLFAGGATPTPQQIMAASPTKGLAVLREQRQAETAGLQQRTSQLEFDTKQREQMANDIFAVLSLPPEQQGPAYRQLNEVEYVNRGWRKPGDPYPAMPTPEQAKAIAIQGFGQAKWEDLENKRAAEARAVAEHTEKMIKAPYERRQAAAQALTAEDIAAGTQPESPHQKAIREAQERPNTPDEWIAWRSQPGRTPEQVAMADKIIAAMTQYHQAIRPQIVQPTDTLVDSIMKNPAIYQSLSADMKAKVAPELTARGFTQFEGKPTQGQFEANRYYLRMKGAEDTISRLQEHAKTMGLFDQGWYSFAPNWLQSKENQQLRQAQRAFTEARLRKESGAAIPPAEYESDAKTYFWQPGDSPEVLAQKQQSRALVMQGLAEEAGPALKPTKPAQPPAGAGLPISGVPKVGETFNGQKVLKVEKVQ